MAKRFSQLILFFSAVAYLSVFVSPAKFWPAGFISLGIPGVLVFNLLLLVYWTVRRSKWFFYPLAALILGVGYMKHSVVWNRHSAEDPSFSVLNYNVRVFNVYDHLNEDYQSSQRSIAWVTESKADFKCLQEFYNDPDSELFNTIQRIGEKQGYEHYFQKNSNAKFGLVIFSKHPIINKGALGPGPKELNHVIFVDVLVGSDTLRVYNMHLESMSIDENALVNPDPDKLDKNIKSLIKKLKKGFSKRADQVDLLVQHIRECPYPIVLAGDMNDLPYSYSYRKLKSALDNAFEDAGQGFGISYNGKLPFLRIDNQFYHGRLKVLQFETHQQVKESDHFPVSASYRLHGSQ